MRADSRILGLVARNKLRMASRHFIDTARNTLEGKLAVITLLASPFLMKSMLVKASLRAADANRELGLVILTCAHLALVISLILGVMGQVARDLIVDRKDDPLAFHPDGRRALAAHHLWSVVTVASLVILSFFYLFFGALIPGLTNRALLAIPTHVIAHALVLCALGVVAYSLSLRLLEWRPALARPLDIGAGGGSILAFLVMAGSGTFFMDLEPATLARLGAWSARAAVVYPPLAVLIPETKGLLGPVAWAIGIFLAPLIALAAARRPLSEPSRLLFGEIGAPLGHSFPSIFRATTRPRRRGLATLHIFFLKDIALPAQRHVQRSIIRNWVLLAVAVTTPVALWQLRREGRITETAAEAVIWGVVMVLPSITAYLHGLGSLGREGAVLALLRPAVRPARLFTYKLLPVLLIVVLSGLLFGAITGAVATGLALGPGPLEAAAIGGVTGIVAGLNAVALGFLFPDFRRHTASATGSSWAGRRSFEGLAIYGIGMGVAMRAIAGTPLLPAHLLPNVLALTTGMGVVLAGALSFFALRRFPNLEI